jgi:hypothetical protein
VAQVLHRVVEERDVAAGREPLQADGEQHDQEQPEPEVRHGEADEGDGGRRVVRRLASPGCGDDPGDDPDQRAEQHGQEGELERDRQPRDDRVPDRQLPLVGAEIAPEDVPHPGDVLDRERPVEPVVVADRGEHLGVAVLAAERERRVTRQRTHPSEDDHARQREHDQGGSGLSQQEAAHDRDLF